MTKDTNLIMSWADEILKNANNTAIKETISRNDEMMEAITEEVIDNTKAKIKDDLIISEYTIALGDKLFDLD